MTLQNPEDVLQVSKTEMHPKAVLFRGSLSNKDGSSTHVAIQNVSVTVVEVHTTNSIPQGPYFLSPKGDLHQAYRVYADTEGAFTQPLAPYDKSGNIYSALPVTVPGIDAPGVAVPSQLYYTKTASKPLAGVRIGIKDIYDISGVRTSDSNRAFYDLYPPRNATALPVQRLIDAGAILVGKMKTSQFANGEVATADWVDYHEPFNPRGDGYQDTSPSSSGPGSAEGSYPWLHITLGFDTGGSIRGPSQVQGIYGNRPTHGLVPLTNTMPLAPELDTAGFCACTTRRSMVTFTNLNRCRDPNLWTTAAKVLYEDALVFFPQFPPKIQTIGFPTPSVIAPDATTAAANTLLLIFLSKLEGFLSLTSSPLNYTNLCIQKKPDPSLPPLPIRLNRTYPTLISKEQPKNVRNPFYADYAAAHGGRLPFVDPVPRVSFAAPHRQTSRELTEGYTSGTLGIR